MFLLIFFILKSLYFYCTTINIVILEEIETEKVLYCADTEEWCVDNLNESNEAYYRQVRNGKNPLNIFEFVECK